MSDVIVYGIIGSPYVRSVLVALEEKDIAYRLVRIGFGEQRAPEHVARNAFAKVPVLDHDGFLLYETQAILRYVDQVFDGSALMPSDPRSAARVNQIAGIVDCYWFRHVMVGIAFNRLLAPLLKLPVDEAAIAAGVPHAIQCLGELERLKGDRAFMVGDSLSIADIMLAPQLAMVAMTPEVAGLMPSYPQLAAWLERMSVRPSMERTTRDRLLEAA
jgi:glutathione S-transferase